MIIWSYYRKCWTSTPFSPIYYLYIFCCLSIAAKILSWSSQNFSPIRFTTTTICLIFHNGKISSTTKLFPYEFLPKLDSNTAKYTPNFYLSNCMTIFGGTTINVSTIDNLGCRKCWFIRPIDFIKQLHFFKVLLSL